MTIDNNTVTALALVAMILVILLLITLVVIFYLLFKNKSTDNFSDENSANQSSKEVNPELMCHFHNSIASVSTCAICEKSLCEACHKDYEKINLCPEHFNLYGLHNWVPITNEKTTPDTPEKGHFIYHFKNELWKSESIPSYIQYHYKIDVENDYIESYVRLYVREEDEKDLSLKFDTSKSKTAH